MTTQTRGVRLTVRLLSTLSLVTGLLIGGPVRKAYADQSERPGSVAQASITAADSHTCVIVGNGGVRCWGNNTFGQLGLGNDVWIGDDELPTTNAGLGGVSATALASGTNHTCALLVGGNVRCWGLGFWGAIGLATDQRIGDNELPLVNVNLGGATATAITAGRRHTCALLSDGNIRCWGNNIAGELGIAIPGIVGDNESPTINVNLGGATATAITGGEAYTCALLVGGSVRCWGYNFNGQLGIGNTTTIGDDESPTTNVDLGGTSAIAVSAGKSHTCALLTGGNVRCWGINTFGQLGIASAVQIGDNESPTTNVNLGGASATAITTGEDYACALLVGGNVRCWGRNFYGQLGIGNTTTIGDDESPITNVNLGIAATAVTAGQYHACAVLADANVRCWGNNTAGKLGIGNTTTIGDNEDPITNVPNLTNGTDTTKPAVTLADQTSYTTPLTISGTASDASGIINVQVAIYRSIGSGQYWTGTAWQSAYTSVTATLAAPNATTTTWTYVFNAPPGGTFGIAVLAYDPFGNYGVVPLTLFSIVDGVKPIITVTSPTPSQALASKPVTITGTASDNAGIYAVLVAVYRPTTATIAGQYWNGSAWQSDFVVVPALVSSLGSTTTTWSYVFDPPQTGGSYGVSALVYDTTYNYTFGDFTPFTLPDTIAPTATLSPADNSTTTGTITISGTATDNNALYNVAIAIYRVSDAQYWNGTGWQSTFAVARSTLANPGAASSTFTYNFTPPTPGRYLLGVAPVEANYNFSFLAWNSITAT
jgi:alpha-tubulin suppressor-like RCC1 family protein